MCMVPVYESFILILSCRRSIKIVRLSRIVGCFSPTAAKWSNSDQIFSEEKWINSCRLVNRANFCRLSGSGRNLWGWEKYWKFLFQGKWLSLGSCFSGTYITYMGQTYQDDYHSKSVNNNSFCQHLRPFCSSTNKYDRTIRYLGGLKSKGTFLNSFSSMGFSTLLEDPS